MESLKQKFLLYRKSIFTECETGYIHFLSASRIKSFINEGDFHKISPTFWRYTHLAHSECVFLCLARILDKRYSDSVTIHNFLKLIESEKRHIFNASILDQVKTEIEKDLTYMANRNDLIDRIMRLRDKLLAHLDKKTFNNIDSFFEQRAIEDEEIEKIFLGVEKTVNKYLFFYDGTKPPYDSIGWKQSIFIDFLQFIY